jgi:hypothetical protein
MVIELSKNVAARLLKSASLATLRVRISYFSIRLPAGGGSSNSD